tara:strand:+ start:1426 stop:2655 length:1230 start_codon:yes stop_codon:yes gene_type:complete
MAKVITKQEVARKATDKSVETKMATGDGKLKVKKTKPSMKSMEFDDQPIKVDLSKPLNKKEDEPIQESKTDEVDVQEQTTTSKEVGDGEKKVKKEEIEQPVLEEITEEKKTEEKKVEEVSDAVEEAVQEAEEKGIDLPENIQKVVDFMNETGGDLNDYVKLNQDYSKFDDKTLLREYYNQTKPHLDSDEVDFLIQDRFTYDEDVDEEIEVKRKKLAFKEQVANATNHLDGLKSKFYAEIKAGSKLNPEQQKAIDFFNRYNTENQETEKALKIERDTFKQKTDKVFDNKFKGFEYNVGEKRFRFNVKDVNQVKENQSNINNFVSKFVDQKSSLIHDAEGYHKSLFTAMNSDAIANHFYEQGKTDGVKESLERSKNIDMKPRETGTVDTGGMKVKVISGDSTDKLRFKIRK